MRIAKPLSLLFLLVPILVNAQGNDIEMADALRVSGKIYVVVACLLLIFIGIITYMVILERKLNRIERQINQAEER